MTAASGATSTSSTPQRQRTEIILAQLEQLPTLPAVATRILQATTSAETNAADIVALIETDQALTAKILSLVRRSGLGVSRDVATIDRAVVLLGFAAVRNAVLSIQIYETFAGVEPGGEAALDRGEFWKHSLAVACAAQAVARRSRPAGQADEAFVCGLLHDLGKIALDACLPKSYARIIRETNARRACICDVERAVLGLDHTIAGKRLAEHWKLPPSIVETVWLHHHPPGELPASIDSGPLIRVVHLADHLVRQQRIGYSGYHRVDNLSGLAGELGLADDALTDIVGELGPQIEEHSRLFGLSDLTSSTVYAQALTDANQELGRLNRTLAVANQRLERRSSCFDALRGFWQSLHPKARPADVCRAAATCLQQALGLQGPVTCFALDDDPGLLHVGSTLPEPDAATILTADETLPPLPNLAPGRLHPLPPQAQAVSDHLADRVGGEPLRLLPFQHEDRALGGALIPCTDQQARSWTAYAADLETMTAAFGFALATTAVRAESESVAEELAEVSRRLHAAQDELARSKAMGKTSELAAGAAHELNNPLSVIAGRAQMLARDAADPGAERALKIISEQAQRASQIVDELISFAKPDPPKPKTVPLASWLDELRDRWEADSPIFADRFSIDLADPRVTVYADPDQFTAILDALIANSLEASEPENLSVQINSTSRASDDSVVLSVADNGPGMDPDVLEHAIDPFFSHRTAGRGRGLGLSRAYSLTAGNGGRLWLDSAPGQGTTVFLELPSAPPE